MEKKLCSVGDAILMELFPENYDISGIKNVLASADIRLFNLENVISDEAVFGSTYCGGTWLAAGEETLDEVLKFGFNGCSFANNHTMDYSYDGMINSIAALKKRNIPVCGAGESLEEAADYMLVGEKGKQAAVIALSSTFNDAARAGNPSPTVPARPGLNPLRFSTVYNINSEHMKALKEIAEATFIDGRRNRSRLGGYTPMPPEGCFGFGEYVFREAEEEGKITRVNPSDMARTVNGIKNALKETDTVIINIHSHEIPRTTDDEPDMFLVEFARKCIDAGASAVIGTGTHQLKAIEVYKGCPIFYSLGNFIFQTDIPGRMPEDFREKYKLAEGLTPAEMISARAKLGNGGLHADVNNFRSLMPFITFEEGKAKSITLYPLRLDMKSGLPALADENETAVIFDYMCEKNKNFNTEMKLDKNKIELVLQGED